MTWQAFRTLCKLRKAQINEGKEIWVDYENKQISTVVEAGELQNTIDMSSQWSSLVSTIEYLIEGNYIKHLSSTYYKVTHKGFHIRQEALSAFAVFMFRSILVPIGVALVTALITAWIVASPS